jgi:hypothetical protein
VALKKIVKICFTCFFDVITCLMDVHSIEACDLPELLNWNSHLVINGLYEFFCQKQQATSESLTSWRKRTREVSIIPE